MIEKSVKVDLTQYNTRVIILFPTHCMIKVDSEKYSRIFPVVNDSRPKWRRKLLNVMEK